MPFTKDTVWNALVKINGYEGNRDVLLEEYNEETDGNEFEYLRSITEKMCTDELIIFLNESAEDGLKAVEFGNADYLGYLGEGETMANEFCNEHGIEEDIYITKEKVVQIGYGDYSGGSYGAFLRTNGTTYWLTESGKVIVTNEMEWEVNVEGEENPVPLLLVRAPVVDTDIIFTNKISSYFEEDIQWAEVDF